MHLGNAIRAKPHKLFGYELCWWGFSQWYKWRWHGDHIDLGPLSIYNIGPRSRWAWSIVAFLIKPFRYAYHLHINRPKIKKQNQEFLDRLERQRDWEDKRDEQ